jgi:hypothetical protein
VTGDFYSRVEAFSDFTQAADPKNYVPVPTDWWVVITDVRGSTRAIEAGRYKDVNAAWVASIVAVRNALEGADFPFIFGGDGATLLLPDDAIAPASRALRGVQARVAQAFDLDLRVGLVPVRTLLDGGFELSLARFQPSASMGLAMLHGNGVAEAERLVKDDTDGARYELSREGPSDLALDGFECRWQPIPARRGQSVSLLVQARGSSGEQALDIYQRVLSEIDSIVRGLEGSCPVSEAGLRLISTSRHFDQEARLGTTRHGGLAYHLARAKLLCLILLGRVIFLFGLKIKSFDGKDYKRELVSNSDFRKFDETIRMVLDLPRAEVDRLVEFLERERDAGRLVYGMHLASASLMTCIVTSYSGNHVHFVDGADGGYALAAKQLKRQLSDADS